MATLKLKGNKRIQFCSVSWLSHRHKVLLHFSVEPIRFSSCYILDRLGILYL